MQNIDILSGKLGYQFQNITLLQTALTHRSSGSSNNERMEFLGDSILGYVISSELYQRFSQASEGELSRMRASLVRGETLAGIAQDIGLGDHLQLGSGELKSGGFRRKSILADAFEAVIGAVYLDSDIQSARQFILKYFSGKLDACDPSSVLKDPKTRLQEYLQSRGEAVPEYNVLSVSGQAHKQEFEVECKLAVLDLSTTGRGTSRRKAEQAAAAALFAKLNIQAS